MFLVHNDKMMNFLKVKLFELNISVASGERKMKIG